MYTLIVHAMYDCNTVRYTKADHTCLQISVDTIASVKETHPKCTIHKFYTVDVPVQAVLAEDSMHQTGRGDDMIAFHQPQVHNNLGSQPSWLSCGYETIYTCRYYFHTHSTT